MHTILLKLLPDFNAQSQSIKTVTVHVFIVACDDSITLSKILALIPDIPEIQQNYFYHNATEP
jgi:hypothetical protein